MDILAKFQNRHYGHFGNISKWIYLGKISSTIFKNQGIFVVNISKQASRSFWQYFKMDYLGKNLKYSDKISSFLTIFQNQRIICILSIFQNRHYGLLAVFLKKDLGILVSFITKALWAFWQ